ncbi:MAG: ubiquinol oxidase subunit II [Nevskiales bacterium]
MSTTLLLMTLGLSGCDFWLFDPKGPIAAEQMFLIILCALVMLIVVVPVTLMGVWFPLRYGKGKRVDEYRPDWQHSNKIEAVVWAIPILIILTLGTITWFTSHSLDPRQPIESDKPTLVVQVVAMDWKWLFIYPEQGIASVNEMAMPVGRPVEFLVTSDTVMNSFFIPQLGTQIYAMSGMENRVHLQADEAGSYEGFSANYSGFGFSGMKFKTLARDEAGFERWVREIKANAKALDDAALAALRVKSRDVAPMHFSSVDPLLFSDIIERYAGALGNAQ